LEDFVDGRIGMLKVRREELFREGLSEFVAMEEAILNTFC
jgi:hypothetical protein